MGWYKHWFGTPYYKLLYGHRDEAEAEAWVDAILGRWGLQPNARVLDLACGRGRHARWFAARGMRVTGADISEESIAEARIAVPEGDFLVHDMRETLPRERFDGICCLFTSLGYFDDLADDQRVMDAVCAMLVPGGRFVLDFMNTPVVLRDLVESESIIAGGLTFQVQRKVEGEVLVKRITLNDAGCSHAFEERVQALRPAQIEAMAVKSGLEVLDCSDGPDALPFGPDRSSRFVLWARKPLA